MRADDCPREPEQEIKLNSLIKVLISILIVIPLSVGAHNKVVVVPLLDEVAGLQNVITV